MTASKVYDLVILKQPESSQSPLEFNHFSMQLKNISKIKRIKIAFYETEGPKDVQPFT